MSSETAVWQAVKQGLGQALMPCFAAEQVDDLVQVTEQPHWVRREVWLMVHPELRRTARIDQALQWLDSLFDSQGAPLKVGSD